jgi:protein SCO1/2
MLLTRRSLLQDLALAAMPAVPTVSGHGQIKPPIPVPDIPLVCHDGASATLFHLVSNHATAVQLMFTSCTTTCPIEAAIFERVQATLPDMPARGMQLLSLSVDPQTDTPAALAAWRQRFHAGPTWIAAAPAMADVQRLQDFFAKALDSADHSTQVSIVDRQARLVWRTYELPTAQEIVQILQKV